MNKEEYNVLKEKEAYNEIAYHYFKDMRSINDIDLSWEQFKLKFNQFIAKYNGQVIKTNSGFVCHIEVGLIRNKILNYFNQKWV